MDSRYNQVCQCDHATSSLIVKLEQGQLKKFHRNSQVHVNKFCVFGFPLNSTHPFLQIVCAISVPFISMYKLFLVFF